MMHEILFLGKAKSSFIREGIEEYQKRLQHYTKFSIQTLKDPGAGKSGDVAIKLQGDALCRAVPAGVVRVVLDSRGRQFTSEEFAEQIIRWENSGAGGACYLIGGPEGHSEDIVKSADLLLSFSKMTFTHDLIRLLLVEQLYRAYTIKAGEKYHK